jgi:hypothetical protein
MLNIKVIRYTTSLDYRKDATKPYDWLNNDANNCQDDFIVYWGTNEVLKIPVQTVCNLQGLDIPERGSPRIKFEDTVATGTFLLKTFVEPRNFYGRIHGICDTKTLAGDYVQMDSTTRTNKLRWLMHDTQKHRKDAKGNLVPPMTLTRVAWSAGCIVANPDGLSKFGAVLDQYGTKPGQTIPGVIVLQNRA